MASPSCCALQNVSVMALPVTPGIMEVAFAITLPSWTYKRRISDKVPSSVPSLQHRSPASRAVGLERKGKATCAICWVTVRSVRGKTCDVHRFAGLQESDQSKFSVPYIKVHSYFAANISQCPTTQPLRAMISNHPPIPAPPASIVSQELSDKGQGTIRIHLTGKRESA